jgi:hypothetical protein
VGVGIISMMWRKWSIITDVDEVYYSVPHPKTTEKFNMFTIKGRLAVPIFLSVSLENQSGKLCQAAPTMGRVS